MDFEWQIETDFSIGSTILVSLQNPSINDIKTNNAYN